MEEVYSKKWYLEEGRRSIKYKRSSNRVQNENKYRSKETREVGLSRRMRF